MTDAPDRIRTNPQGTALVTDFGRWEADVEYHRADLTAAAVAAALQGALASVDRYLMVQTGLDVVHVCNVKDAIIARIHDDGLAALEAHAARVRAEAIMEVAQAVDSMVDEVVATSAPQVMNEEQTELVVLLRSLVKVIRAMAKSTAKEGGEG